MMQQSRYFFNKRKYVITFLDSIFAFNICIQAALLQTKNVKDTTHTNSSTSQDARWIRRVIEDEHLKPIQVNWNT